MKIVWSPLAVEKVGDFAALIASDKPMVAGKWAEEIFESVERLADLPYSGKMVPEIRRAEIREIYNGNYRIIYRLYDDKNHVLTVRHRRQLLSEKDLNA